MQPTLSVRDCIFPVILHLFQPRSNFQTSYHTIKDELVKAGANWVDSETVVDRNWVPSRQPSDIPRFNEKIKELFWAGQQPSCAKAASKYASTHLSYAPGIE